jgi:glycosyltransferase involved in cell wall biosynthesis
MRICLFTPSFLPDVGGMEVVVDRLAKEFLARGHEPLVIAQGYHGPCELPELPYDVVHYPKPRSAVWLLHAVRRVLMREHQRRGFHVIHAHMAYPTGYIACRLRARLQTPVVVTSHKGDIVPDSRYQRRRITRARIRWTLQTADAATGVSQGLTYIIDDLSSGKANSCYIPNGVDLPGDGPGTRPQALSDMGGGEYVLTLGRLHRHKGLDVLLEAVRQLADRGDNVPHLVIAGEGREMQSLRERASRLGIEQKVVFCGMVHGDQKHWLLRNCRFFLQPSRVEGMPLTVLEAMAYGKPVVGTSISGISELVRHGENGLLVRPGDAMALADAISGLLRSGPLTQMQAAARRTAETMTWATVADRYLQLYDDLRSVPARPK